MKILSTVILLLLFSASACAAYDIIDSNEGQQVVFDENRRLTVFSDEELRLDDPICVYMDSTMLKKEKYDVLEWNFVDKIEENSVTIRTNTYRLLLPSYITEDDKISFKNIHLTGSPPSGKFETRGIKIKMIRSASETVIVTLER